MVVALRSSDCLRHPVGVRLDPDSPDAATWLGADEAVEWLRANPSAYETLRAWPFFAMQFDMLTMVLAKADTTLARYYARRLADAPQQRMTEALIARLESLREALPQLYWRPLSDVLGSAAHPRK